jgi:hypothetical protein
MQGGFLRIKPQINKGSNMTNKHDIEKEQNELEQEIEDIDLYDKSADEIERVIRGLSSEAMELRRKRKKIRYQLYRLHNEALGKCDNVSEPGFKEIFEQQALFDKWKNFSISWDVALDDPYRIVHRIRSVTEEWEEVVAAKFPLVSPGGKITYPDITVRKKVEAEAKLQAEVKKDSDSE